VRDVREDSSVEKAVDAAYLRWARADEAWEAVTWAIARDPFGAGPSLDESGNVRLMVFDGARSIDMPSVRIVYVIDHTAVTVRQAEFSDSIHMYAGNA
jgi:hypothetical protein